MANVVEKLFELNVVEVLLLTEFALLEDTTECFDHLVTHVNHSLTLDELESLRLDYA